MRTIRSSNSFGRRPAASAAHAGLRARRPATTAAPCASAAPLRTAVRCAHHQPRRGFRAATVLLDRPKEEAGAAAAADPGSESESDAATGGDEPESILIYSGERARPLRILKVMSIINCSASLIASPIVSPAHFTPTGHLADLFPCLSSWRTQNPRLC